MSTVTWYICAIGSWTRYQARPRVVEIEAPPSFPTIIRLPFVGSIHMSWLSPPGDWAKGMSTVVWPPSSVFENAAERKYASFSSFGATATRV